MMLLKVKFVFILALNETLEAVILGPLKSDEVTRHFLYCTGPVFQGFDYVTYQV